MSRTRLALIGCGGMSRAHLRRFDILSDRLELVAAVDVDESRAAAVAELVPGLRVATDVADVLDDIDAALLVLPHHLHHSIAMTCLQAGKHVLLEKPMAITEAECLELIDTARSQDLTLMVAYCMRFHPLVTGMKQLIDDRAVGDVFQVSIWTEQLTRYHEGHWALSEATLGGGQLLSHGCHYIDLLLWYLGRPVRGHHMGTNKGTEWMEREGTSNVTIEFEDGRLGYHFGTWGARATRLGYTFHAHGTEGLIEADISEGQLRVLRPGGDVQVISQHESGKHTENEMRHFLDCIETGQQPLTDGPGSLQGLRLIWRLYEAEDRGGLADLRGLGLDEVDAAGGLAS
ncbi:MAG: Gfo/Idh/MocA family oxidoreductase [Gemmatimonadetes bacterium]|jgi:predicted dehydrogenase|nr:Gfo/Idh/MocA family oxidoreductase [Gemmatimonadota bacterium]MBT6145983.1 Gfo/Idh/MocA family oxidoreductase [Gemmatimonadota bacterium]MBT7862672.1 Gfo/Idh/MocA family oxidoreductase [Gemmatimonadota bacterium]